ncbi:MAG: AAA family ATPase [Eubacterium sp.]|nr:AAA family ATPase [Eubacterium sp.]
MLTQFTVKNYKSIRDEITLDMQAAAISEHEDAVIKILDPESHEAVESFLPVSVLYGPNGSGKSNVLEALHTLESKVLRPICAVCPNDDCSNKGKKMPIKPFLFSETSKNEPTEFEIFFRTDEAEYRYILHIKNDNVVYESLDRVKIETGRRSALFVREKDLINLKGAFSRIRISDEMSDTLPMLSYLGITYQRNKIVKDIFRWFEQEIDFLNYGNPLQEMGMAIAESDTLKKLILKMIQEMNMDIENFRVEEKEEELQVYMQHNVDGYIQEIDLADESSGTQKLFGLLPFIAKSLVFGTTLVIDELDAKIHPLLLRYVIELYTDPVSNKKGGQLIFTSHDLSTMNSEVFRRDEIWFVAKGHQQNSKLYSLVEFKNKNGESVRKDAKFDKQYLEGKYGADPYLRKIIDWSEINA